MKRKHLERYPLAPTADQQRAHATVLFLERVELGLDYQTGPRYGQQLARARSATRPT